MSEEGTETTIATTKETEQKPRILWRAFTVNPKDLTNESLKQPLVPGTSAEDDPTRVADGNERGVYMSTNRAMVECAYAHTSRGLSVPSPRFNDEGSMTSWINLPQCGIIVEIDTEGLEIRKPKIIPALQGHYNNGFAGDEYIADTVPPENYKVVRLILSRWANDNERLVVDIDGYDPENLSKGIDNIQKEFTVREQKAVEFATFLETLDPRQRLNSFIVKRKWQQHLEANKSPPSS